MKPTLSLRGRWRRLALGLPTVLGLTPRGWFIPHRYAPLLPPPGAQPPYPAVEALFESHAAAFEAVLDLVDSHADGARRPSAACSISRGSRRSTPRSPTRWCVTASRSMSWRSAPAIRHACWPRPWAAWARSSPSIPRRAPISPACPVCRSCRPRSRRRPSSCSTGWAAATSCSSTSSHILMPGSDVDLLLNRVLPRLPSGVLVHIHDIFLPFDYPPIWGWRAYNEQQGALPLLTTGAYVPVFSSVWAGREAGRPAGTVGGGAPAVGRARPCRPASGWRNDEARRCVPTIRGVALPFPHSRPM